MVANFMAPFDAPGARDGKQWRTFPAYSQAPLLAWGMERVYLRNGDKQLLHEGMAALESFHEWYWRERDIQAQGLAALVLTVATRSTLVTKPTIERLTSIA